jgi:hypothetical protein
MKSQAPKPIIKRSKRVWLWALFAAIILAITSWVYWSEPIAQLPIPNADYWDHAFYDVVALAAALAAGLLGVRLMRHFEHSEPPYRIWFFFTLGWWAWVGGEVAGMFYDHFYWFTDYPEFSLMDIFWLLGYVFFGLSLYYQFRLIYSYKQGVKSRLYLVFIAAGLLISLGLTQWALAAGLGEGYSWGALYLSVTYPVFDLVEGAAALWLFFLFGRGYLGRPWWGLIFFAVADAINIFFWIGGYNLFSDQVYNQLDLFSNIAYLAGYMVTALACLAASDHIERGLAANTFRN